MKAFPVLLLMRWPARIVGTLLLLLMLAIAIGEGGPPNPWTQPWQVNVELHLMFAMWIGMLLAWRWEGLGGALMIGGAAAFCAMEAQAPNLLFGAILACGGLYITCWLFAEPDRPNRHDFVPS